MNDRNLNLLIENISYIIRRVKESLEDKMHVNSTSKCKPNQILIMYTN
jgi:hypothetical protein